VLEVFRRFGSIQFDPLAVAARNHDLVLHSTKCQVLRTRRPTGLDRPTLTRARSSVKLLLGVGRELEARTEES